MDGAISVNTADLELVHANIARAMAETVKLGAETAKIREEQRYYPAVGIGASIVATARVIAAVLAKA